MLAKLAKPFQSQISKFSRKFSELSAAKSTGVVKREKLQFSKKRLTDWGELPLGEIPDALQYDLPFEVSKLANGVKVGVESWKSQLATVVVSVRSGSRNETLETSGASQFIKYLSLRGTPSRNRTQFENDLDALGGNLTVDVGRESTVFSLTVQPKDLSVAVQLLSDIVKNPLFNKNQVEAERDEILRNASENHKDQMSTTLEAAHYTSYRDHFIGQPVLGIRENIGTIGVDQLKEFHESNFVGDNIAVVATGNVNAQQFADLANQHFGNIKKEGPQAKNSEKPYFTPSTLYMRDDEMANVNVGVFFQAPTWSDPDFFALKVIQQMLGEYQANKYTGAHLNTAERQYNTIHGYLGSYPDVSLHKCLYIPYKDTALFGSYLMGNEVFGYQMLYLSQFVLTEYASYINQAELFRARNSIYNCLLKNDSTQEVATKFAEQLQYFGRRVPKSEFAKRVSHMDAQYLSRVITKWFWDADLSVAAWGPLHGMMTLSHYNRPLRRSTLGWYGTSHLHVV